MRIIGRIVICLIIAILLSCPMTACQSDNKDKLDSQRTSGEDIDSNIFDSIDYSSLVITLERTECFGICPVYRVTITGDGEVTYEGYKYVKVTGVQNKTLTREQIDKLVEYIITISYFSLSDEYPEIVNGEQEWLTDVPLVLTSVSINGQVKSINDNSKAPESLRELERKIDEIAGTMEWVGSRDEILLPDDIVKVYGPLEEPQSTSGDESVVDGK